MGTIIKNDSNFPTAKVAGILCIFGIRWELKCLTNLGHSSFKFQILNFSLLSHSFRLVCSLTIVQKLTRTTPSRQIKMFLFSFLLFLLSWAIIVKTSMPLKSNNKLVARFLPKIFTSRQKLHRSNEELIANNKVVSRHSLLDDENRENTLPGSWFQTKNAILKIEKNFFFWVAQIFFICFNGQGEDMFFSLGLFLIINNALLIFFT